jgi:hypothetical protein
MTGKLLSAAALAALSLAAGIGTAAAQAPFKIGVSAAATGPASPNYAPNVEGLRLYVRALNDRGGVDGSKIELLVLDDKAAPSEAASNAKRLMDDEQGARGRPDESVVDLCADVPGLDTYQDPRCCCSAWGSARRTPSARR